MTWNELLAWLVTAVVLPSLALILRNGLPIAFEWMRANIKSKNAGLAAVAAVAGAGRVALDVIQAKQDNPSADIRAVLAAGIKREGAYMVESAVKETAEKIGLSQYAAEKMVEGRIAPILAPAQAAEAAAVAVSAPLVSAATDMVDAATAKMDRMD